MHQQQQQALAACANEIITPANEIQLLPDGQFRAHDGRPTDTPHWLLNQQIADKLIAQVIARKTDCVIDYEHQSLHTANNGKPAPAAGWISDLTYKPGKGLFATVKQWTAAATKHITDQEYRYISPVFAYDTKTGAITKIVSVALTNTPALDGMSDVLAAALATLTTTTQEDAPMDNDLLKLLGIEPSEDEAKNKQAALDAIAKLQQAQQDDAGKDDSSSNKYDVAGNASESQQQAATTDATDTALAQQVAALTQQVSTLQAQAKQGAVSATIDAALIAGKITAAQSNWARTQTHWDVAACQAWLATQLPIAALSGTQQVATMTDDNGLTADEIAICTATGTDPKDFAATKKQGA